MLSKEEYLDNLLKGVAEQDHEQNKVKTLVEEAMPELTMEEEPELELSAEPESDAGVDAALDEDLAALLESVPEMAVEEEGAPAPAAALLMELNEIHRDDPRTRARLS